MLRLASTARLALFAALATAACQGSAQTKLQPFSSTFEGRKKVALVEAKARAQVELQRSGTYAMYTVSASARWTVLTRNFDECSVVRFEGDRIVPLEFVHVDHSQPEHDVRTEYDWARGKAVTRLGDGSTRTNDIAWPTWDPMSLQLALMAAAPTKRPGDQETHTVIERGVVKEHRVTYVGATAGSSPPTAGQGQPAAPVATQPTPSQPFVIQSKKGTGGEVALVLDAARNFEPLRIGIDDVNLDRATRRPAPAALAAGIAPRCRVTGPK